MSELSEVWAAAVAIMLAHVVKPALAVTGLTGIVGDPAGLAEYLLIGIAQVFVIGIVFLPLETLLPVERQDRKLVRVDMVHTLVNLLGIVPFGTYLVLVPLGDAMSRLVGHEDSGTGWHLGYLVPWLGEHPFALFMVYFVILDFASYVMHRLEHQLRWWWAMHSLHHSQRNLNRWTDDRGNVIDSVLQAVFIGAWGLVIGVPPVEYGLIAFLGKMLENLSHANTRLRFGPVLDKLLIDPPFHRQHHMIADPTNYDLHNCNFGFVFPWWDILFGTALYDGKVRPTGVDDEEVDADNEKGWWGQQVASTERMLRALRVSFARSTAGLRKALAGDRA